MKNKALGFSMVGSSVIIAFMVFVNYTTSPGFPWFIFPVFAVLWWPLGVFFARNRNPVAFSIIGTLLISALMVITNLVTSPGFLWFVFPVFAVLWWPLSVIFSKNTKVFPVVSSVLIIGFFLIVNIFTSFSHPWFIYPAFAVIWWPLAVLVGRGKHKLFSVLGFILINAFFVTVNLIVSPGYIWFIHISYAVLWWPLSIFLAKRSTIRLYSLAAAVLTIVYLALANFMNEPEILWFLYAVYPLLLWPAIMYTGRHSYRLPFAIAGSITGIAYYLVLNIFVSPGHPWILYLLLPLVWWPVVIAFRKVAANALFLLISATIFTIYYGLLNIFVSPGHFWSLSLIFPYAWVVIGVYFGKRRKPLGLAVAGTIITSIYLIALNLIYTPATIWAVFPIFAILWWPVSIHFFKTRNKAKDRKAVS